MSQDSPDKIIDKSARLVFSFFISSAGLWLLAAALLAYIAAAKLTDPFFLASCEFLTYGKVKVAQANAFVYGWGGNAIFAVSLWILARLSQAEIRGRLFLILAGVIWNIAITRDIVRLPSIFSRKLFALWNFVQSIVDPVLNYCPLL